MADEVAAGVEAMKVGDDATAAPAPAPAPAAEPAAEPAAAETTAEPEAAETAETTESAAPAPAPAPEPAAAGGGGGAGGGAGADEDAGGDSNATEGNGDGAAEGGDGDGDDEEDEAGDQLGEMGPATPRRKPRSKKKRFSFNPAAAEPNWAAMPHETLVSFLSALKPDTASGHSAANPEWVLHGLQEVAKRSDVHDTKVLAEIGASGVVESMCHHIINLEAAEPATAALQALKGLCRLASNVKLVLANDGPQAIAKLVNTFGDNKELVSNACGCFVNISSEEFARVPCSEAGALETLVMALRLHRMDPDIAWLDFAALRNMCMAGENQKKLGQVKNGLRWVNTIMGAQRTNVKVVKMGCSILKHAAQQDVNLGPLVKEGTVETIMVALGTYENDADVHTHGIATLRLLSKSAEARSVAADQNVEAVMKQIEKRFKKNSAIKKAAAACRKEMGKK